MTTREHQIRRGWRGRADSKDPSGADEARGRRRARRAVANDGKPLALAAVVLGLTLLFLNAGGGVDLEALIGTLLP